MSKLIQKNPYDKKYHNESSAWDEGFVAGQKSTLTPVSVTGRWWQSSNKRIFFANAEEYEGIQRAVDNNPSLCQWLTEEETREFE